MNYNQLEFFFDLSLNGLNYGVVYSLCLAEIERKRLGARSIRFSIVPTEDESGFSKRSHRDSLYEVSQKEWRLHNLIVPAARLLPSVRGVILHGKRNDARPLQHSSPFRFPRNYSIDNPIKKRGSFQLVFNKASKGMDVQHIRAPQFALQAMEQWLRQHANLENTVTITLRQSDVQPDRNSSLSDWLELATHLEKEGYTPVFICDTELILFGTSGLPDTVVRCDLAALNLELRCALYELAKLNFFVSNGPLSLALCNKKISYISCKWLVEGYTNTSKKFFEKVGLLPAGQMPGRQNKYGKIIWETDHADRLIHAFEIWRTTSGAHES